MFNEISPFNGAHFFRFLIEKREKKLKESYDGDDKLFAKRNASEANYKKEIFSSAFQER